MFFDFEINNFLQEDYAIDAFHAIRHDTQDAVFLVNVEYKVGGLDFATFADKSTKEDLAQRLVKEGFLLVDNRKERRLQKLVRSKTRISKFSLAKNKFFSHKKQIYSLK